MLPGVESKLPCLAELNCVLRAVLDSEGLFAEVIGLCLKKVS
jgi:hypothetical protein